MSMTRTTTTTMLGAALAFTPTHRQPLFGSRVRAGFPSPADDHLDTDIDLHAHVVKRPAATFFVRAVDGELTVKRLERVGQRTYLTASNPHFRSIPLDGREAHVWGVVTHVVHTLPGAPT
ncbi:LexA family protein [Halomonas sp.]|uniref:LexA family protein n=1 Tax=Halomonas sp. TaxID=1486246 RepID=UPI00356B3ED1